MTITERNQKLYELRNSLLKKRTELAWIESQIMAVNQQYKDEQMGDLYEQMFSN
jgi:ribosomal protein L29